MFKEALAGIFILFLFYLICRFLQKKNNNILSILTIIVLTTACLSNIVYNSLVMFPDFYMDTVGGVYRYGTFSGNLFSYSDEFMFQDNILFPILKNRTVALDESADFYYKFFFLYSQNTESIPVSNQSRLKILSHIEEDFDFSHEFSCIGIMDYVTEEIPEALVPSFEEEIYPMLYINTTSLQNQSALVIVMDDDYTLYVMGTEYYETITGGNDHV